MAWIVGLATDDEIALLRARGWEVEDAREPVRKELALVDSSDPRKTETDHMYLATGRETKIRAVQVYVDTDLFEIMSGSDWDTRPDGCRGEEEVAQLLESKGE